MERTTAPGSDNVKRDALLEWDPKGEELTNMFNAILYSGKIPNCRKGSQITPIPKSIEKEKLMDLNQWRPITIGSVILRAFSSILTQRLANACQVHKRKGFH